MQKALRLGGLHKHNTSLIHSKPSVHIKLYQTLQGGFSFLGTNKKPMEQNNSVVHQAEAFTPAVASFSGLCYGPHSKKLSFRVLREWNSCSLHNYYEISTNYVILDSQVSHSEFFYMYKQ